MAEKYVFGPIAYAAGKDFQRADLEFYGIDPFRPSFSARIFFNDPAVEFATATEDRPSYAGSFAVFGHERCSGDAGHCDAHTEQRRFDDRRSHPLTRAFKRVIVTDALRKVAAAGEKLTITVIVAGPADGPARGSGKRSGKGSAAKEHHYERLLDFRGLQLVTFD